MKHLKKFETLSEQLDNHEEKEKMAYKEAIMLYKNALDMLESAIDIFENSPYGLPEELDMLFGESQGNETLYTLQKEVEYLESLNDDEFGL